MDVYINHHQKKEPFNSQLTPTNKSQRNGIDHQAPIGMGATNTMDRIAAMMGDISEVSLDFKASQSVANAGVLLALPALLSVGLLHNTRKHFQLPKGYYGLASIFLLLAFMALARIKNVERLRYYAPGEWGKILGLDRIPEVRTLREKLKILSKEGKSAQWGADLCSQWMAADPDSAATLYIDGHVRVYHGTQTKLPRHHVARQRLCLRATTDYWVNAMDGQPFFYINKAVDPGLIKVLEGEIVPRLEREIASQSATKQQHNNSLRPKFTLVYDREGYSPAFMLRLKEKNIACITYHKHPGQKWPEAEFTKQQVNLATGEEVQMALGERGSWLGGKLWVREIRKLSETGHQTSIIATHYAKDFTKIAASMFARCSEENFFKYMRQHYNIDRLIDYYLEDIPDTTPVVNPDYRQLNVLKGKRKETQKHITIAELPERERFSKLATQTKQLIDTVKMVAYRAETALVNILREKMSRNDDARQLVVAMFQLEADILPDHRNKTLTVRLHRLANHSNDQAIENLCNEMNETEVVFPGIDFKMIYEFSSKR